MFRFWPVLLIGFYVVSGCAGGGKITSEYLAGKYSDRQSRYMQIGGMQLHYKDEGQGKPVVLLHGISSSLQTWDAWTEVLKSQYRVIRLDLPGFGLTGPDPQDIYSVDRYVAVLDTLLQRLDIGSSYMAGNSLGGWITWEFALQHPQTVSRMILIDAAGFATPDDPPKPIRLIQNPLFRNMAMKRAPRFLVRKFLKQAYGDRSKVSKELVNRYYELSNRPGNPKAFYTIANSHFESHTELLPTLKVPTLIMWGAEDKKWIDVSHAYLFQELLPDNKLIIYQGVGHLPMEEAPQESVQDALKFFSH